MDFVSDRVAGGHLLKYPVIVDEDSHEVVAAVVEHTIGGDQPTRILDEICARRGKAGDLGLGSPELGFVSLREAAFLRGPLGLPVERDLYFHAAKGLRGYASDAHASGRIRL